MSIYTELLDRIVRAWRDASNGFHPAEATQKIVAAQDGFRQPFDELAGLIARQRAGLFPNPEAYRTAADNALRLLDADFEVLSAAVEAAARADRAKAARVIVDQAAAVRKAKQQQAADQTMEEQVAALIRQARDDAAKAGALPPPAGGPLPLLDPVDLEALSKEIETRAAPKEDAVTGERIARIGGQIEPR